MLRQILLSTFLIAIPVAAFAAIYIYILPPNPTEASLGDLSGLKLIATDTMGIASKGNLALAEKRITDFETLWDKDEEAMRPLNEAAWGNIDDAADTAIHSLRSEKPDAPEVASALKGLIAVLDNPYSSVDQGGLKMINGIAVTDESGHPLACENLIKALRAAIEGGRIPDDESAAALTFVSKAVERCNADDDLNANRFSAQGLALASHS